MFFNGHSQLSNLLDPNVHDFGRKLFEAELITATARDSHRYEDIMKEFLIRLEPLDKESLEDRCSKFFDAFGRMEGAIPVVAGFLKDELLQKMANELPEMNFQM